MSIHTLVYSATPLGDNLVGLTQRRLLPSSSCWLLRGLDGPDTDMAPGLLRPCHAQGIASEAACL